MTHVAFPDPIYDKAVRAARASGVSVEEWLVRTVVAGLDEERFVLTPEQEASVRQSQEDIRAGRFSTLDEAFARLDARKAAYLAENPR